VRPPRRKHSTNASPAPTEQDDDDVKLNDMIEEILKSTPDPTQSLVSKRSSQQGSSTQRKSLTREDLEKSLNCSQVFKEVRPTEGPAGQQNRPVGKKVKEVLSLMDATPGQPLERVLTNMDERKLEELHQMQQKVSKISKGDDQLQDYKKVFQDEYKELNALADKASNLELKVSFYILIQYEWHCYVCCN